MAALLLAAGAANAPADRLLEGLPSFDVGEAPSALVVADFDGDGIDDLATADHEDDTVSVILGTGRGHFLLPRTTMVQNGPSALAVADVNDDEADDLIVVHDLSGHVVVLRNTGGGSFEAMATMKLGGSPRSVAAGDLNGDLLPDIVATQETFNNVAIFLNVDGASFAEPLLVAAGDRPTRVLLLNVDGDDDLDLVTTNATVGGVSVFRNDGTGTFGFPVTYPTNTLPFTLAAADFNGDTLPDLLVVSEISDRATVLLNQGGGTFGDPAISYQTGDQPRCVVAGHLNDDEHVDFAIGRAGNTAGVLLLFGVGDGTFVVDRVVWIHGDPSAVSTIDADRDGVVDLAVADATDSIVRVSRGSGEGWYPGESFVASSAGSGFFDQGLLDLDGDRITDLAAVHVTYPGIQLFRFDAQGLVTPAGLAGDPVAYFQVEGVDLNGDDLGDLVAVRDTSWLVEVFLNRGDLGFQGVGTYFGNTLLRMESACDINGDGHLDIVANSGTRYHIYLGDGTGQLTALGQSDSFVRGALTIADLDGQNGLDLVTTWSNFDALYYRLNTGDMVPTFGSTVTVPASTEFSDVAVVDFDRDGRNDFVGVPLFSGALVLLSGTEGGVYDESSLVPTMATAFRLLTTDLDGDGWTDVGLPRTGSTPGSTFFRNNGDRTVSPLATEGISKHLTTMDPFHLGTDPIPGLIGLNNSLQTGFRYAVLRNSTPWVVSVVTSGAQAIDVTFNEPMAGSVEEPKSYTLSGTGSGTLGPTPDTVEILSAYRVRLAWETGELADNGDVTIAVDSSVTDLRGHRLGFITSGTQTGEVIDIEAPVSTINVAPRGVAAVPIEAVYSATDAGGSGLAGVDLYVRKEGGDWQLAGAVSGGAISHLPTGGSGRYHLQTVARDHAGNSEVAPSGDQGDGMAMVVFNDTVNAPLMLLVDAGSVAFYPMSAAASVEIDFAEATAGGLVTVSRDVPAVDAPPELDPAQLIGESVSISGTFSGLATITWIHDPDTAGGEASPVNVVYQVEGDAVINRFEVSPGGGSTLRVSGVTSFSDWFAGSDPGPAVEASGVSIR